MEAFYFEVWNRADEDRAREILHDSFRFRGSLGAERVGPDGFIAYLREVHRALGNYRCIIDDLVVEESRAAARMRFTGRHRDVLQGVPATGRQITWSGAAFFKCEDGQITDLWVLGDLVELRRQLGGVTDGGMVASLKSQEAKTEGTAGLQAGSARERETSAYDSALPGGGSRTGIARRRRARSTPSPPART